MRYLYSVIALLFVINSCSSVKQSNSSLLNGNYDDAIATSLDKLRKSTSQKKRDSHILILEEAFAKASQRDTDRINFLKKQSDPYSVEEIYTLYTRLNKRQESIKPLLPLRLSASDKEAYFSLGNYDNELIAYKNELVDLLYDTSVSNLSTAQSKTDYRNTHEDLQQLNTLRPNYKDVATLLEEAHYKGTDFIEVAFYNDSNIALPSQLERELLDFTPYGLNDFWKEYHSAKQADVSYDYIMDVSIREINISPERIQERQLVKEKTIQDGTDFLKDRKGNFILDEDGKKITVDRFIDIQSNYYEVLQSKAVNIVGQVRYNRAKSGQLLKSFPLASEYVFEHYYATYDGDRRALDNNLLAYTRNKEIPFPTNEEMIYDVGEDLKQQLKSIIVNSNL